jgi:hypothetical protein
MGMGQVTLSDTERYVTHVDGLVSLEELVGLLGINASAPTA